VRVAKEPAYDEIRKELAERAADHGVLKLATLIQRREEEERKSESKKPAAPTAAASEKPSQAAAKPALPAGAGAGTRTAAIGPAGPASEITGGEGEEDLRRPDREEALRVLADLVVLQPKQS
jgi:hypothetical protein